MQNESVFLYYTEGSSDKVYQVQLEEVAEGWTVNFQYGRRGKPLREGTKTKTPVGYHAAKEAFDKLVQSKTSKGYTPEESGVAYAGTENAGEKTDFQPKLLNSINRDDLPGLYEEFAIMGMQIKHDGERRGAHITASDIQTANKKGLRTGVQAQIQDALQHLMDIGLHGTEIDAEDMGDHLMVFDILRYRGEIVTQKSQKDRADLLRQLQVILDDENLNEVVQIDHPFYPASLEEAIAYVDAAYERNEEGVVVFDGSSHYVAGRPSSGGVIRKLKFVESATVRVAEISDTKRSVTMEVSDGENWFDVGKCTIPANFDVPPKGQLVEVEYLYAYRNGALFQPVYKGPRSDVDDADAQTSQLKYKD